RSTARQDRAGDHTYALAVRCLRLVDRRCTTEASQSNHRNRASWAAIRGHHYWHRQSARLGPTDIPITYDPPINDPQELAIERETKADGPDLFVCWMQKAPARQLVNLKDIPVVIIAAEASYHQIYDHCTGKYLNQAGVKTEYIRLQDKGIRGNG